MVSKLVLDFSKIFAEPATEATAKSSNSIGASRLSPMKITFEQAVVSAPEDAFKYICSDLLYFTPENVYMPDVAANGFVVTVNVPAAAVVHAESVFAAKVMELVAPAPVVTKLS